MRCFYYEPWKTRGNLFCLMSKPQKLFHFSFQTHPNVDKKLFTSESLIGLKNPEKSFPVNSDVGVLKWRLQTTEESFIPLTSKCFWPVPLSSSALRTRNSPGLHSSLHCCNKILFEKMTCCTVFFKSLALFF